MTKPFSIEEVLIRLHRLVQRSGAAAQGSATLVVGDLVRNVDRREVTRAGEAVELTTTQFELLPEEDVAALHAAGVFDAQTPKERGFGKRHRSTGTERRRLPRAAPPLAAVRGYTDMLQLTGSLTEDGRTSLARVEQQTLRMTALVEDLLLLARLDEGRASRSTSRAGSSSASAAWTPPGPGCAPRSCR